MKRLVLAALVVLASVASAQEDNVFCSKTTLSRALLSGADQGVHSGGRCEDQTRVATFTAANNEFLDNGHSVFAFGDEDISLAIWVRTNGAVSAASGILSRWGAGPQAAYLLHMSNVGLPAISASPDGSASTSKYWSAEIDDSKRHLVVGYHDSVNNLIGISVDGGVFLTQAHAGGMFAASTAWFELGSSSGANYFNGNLARASVHGRVLSQSEVTRLYNKNSMLKCEDHSGSLLTDRVGCWNLDERGGTRYASDTTYSAVMTQAELLALGMTAWYRADKGVNGVGTPADGAAVATWADQSGNGYDLSDGTGSPTFTVDANNGRPAITIDGVTQNEIDFQSDAAIFPSLFDASGDGTVMMRLKTPVGHEVATYRTIFGGTGADSSYQSYNLATSANLVATHDGTNFHFTSKPITLNTWQTLLWQRDADTTIYAGTDDLATASLGSDGTVGGGGGNPAGSLRIAAIGGGNASAAFGLIQELIFFSTSLTENQRFVVQNHLQRSQSVPSDFPLTDNATVTSTRVQLRANRNE